jgi:tetratricopeptide (TPR) repeat protein
LTQLEYFDRLTPNNPDVLVPMARCYNMLDRREQARQTLDAVLEAHPDHKLALRTRGQFALADRQPDRAEQYLLRAVAVWPDDYQTNWLLKQALQEQNKTEAAAARLQIAEEIRKRAERLGELRGRKLSEQPLDPALHYEMGLLLLRSNQSAIAENWFLSALSLDRDYAPAHAALAELYEKRGDHAKAAEHRRGGNPR